MTVVARVPRGAFFYWEKRFAPVPRLHDAILPVHYLDTPDRGRVFGFYRQPTQTLIIGLQQTADAIMAGFRANTRNEIRRAQTEGVLCRVAANFDRFLALYDQMSAWTALPPTAAGYLHSLGGHLHITEATFEDDVLCTHLYITDASIGRARLIRSASQFREAERKEQQLIGRANRLLHFHDILLFQEQGLRQYDMGGYYPDDAPVNESLRRINDFKLSFGGRLTCEANYLSCALHAYRQAHEFYGRTRGGD
jgi:hypothetical protein